MGKYGHRLFQLDGVRGIAALLVAFYHLGSYQSPQIMGRVLEFLPFVSRSYLLVDWFFILSGFVISQRYWGEFKDGVATSAFSKYMFRRFARLYPLHIFTLLLMVLFHWWLVPSFPTLVPEPFQVIKNPFTLLTNISLLHSSGLGDQGCFNCTSWNYPSWSISVEWICYFFLPPFFALIGRSLKSALLISAILFAGLFLFVDVPVGHLDVASWQGLLRCAFGMSIGSLIHRLYTRGLRLNRAARWGAAIGSVFAFQWLPYDTFLVFLMAIAILAFASLRERSLIGTLPMLWLGKISYAIYLLHAPAQDLASFLFRLYYGQTTQSLSFSQQAFYLFIGMGLTLIMATLSHYLIEVPMGKGINRIGKKLWRLKYNPAFVSIWKRV